MPVEIRELVIRASVADREATAQWIGAELARLKREVIDQCLEKIDLHIERSTER